MYPCGPASSRGTEQGAEWTGGSHGRQKARSGAHLCLLMLFFPWKVTLLHPRQMAGTFSHSLFWADKEGVHPKEACWGLSPE